MRHGEEGHALVEAVLLAVLLLVPALLLLMALADVHRAALAAGAAAREAASVAVRHADMAAAGREGRVAALGTLANHRVDTESARVTWSAPGGLARGERLAATVRIDVTVLRLPGLPDASIPVTATHSARIDPYASAP